MAIPLLASIDIEGKTITADALLTQRNIANYLVEDRKAHYHFTVKANQATLLQDLQLFFQDRQEPDFVEYAPPDHGRIETRKTWTTTQLNDYLDFPHVGQAFLIERKSIEKNTGKQSRELAYGLTSQTPEQANPQRVLVTNRGHWCIENSCHYILDWIYDEDRSRIRTGHGPENITITRLRRFAIGVIKSKGMRSVPQKMRELTRNVRLVFRGLFSKYDNIHSSFHKRRARAGQHSIIPIVERSGAKFHTMSHGKKREESREKRMIRLSKF